MLVGQPVRADDLVWRRSVADLSPNCRSSERKRGPTSRMLLHYAKEMEEALRTNLEA